MNKLADAPMGSPWTFKKTQASKLGGAHDIPSSSSTTIRSSLLKLCFYHFIYYVLFLKRQYFLFVCWTIVMLDPRYLVCEREKHSSLSYLHRLPSGLGLASDGSLGSPFN